MGVTTRQRRALGAPVGLIVAALALAATLTAAPASAAPTGASGASGATGAAPKPVKVRLKTHQEFTPTKVVVNAGDTVAITTSGTMAFGGGLTVAKSPVGIAWGKDCDAIFAGQVQRKRPWPAPGLRCWSMIAKVGSGPVFEVGTAKTFRATDAGVLSLGINDNFVRDNKGFWFATITVNAPGAVSTPTTPANPAATTTPTKKKSSSVILYVLIGALLLFVILLVIFVLARRRGNDEDEPEPELVGAAVAAPVAPVAMPLEESPLSAVPTGAAPLPESIDVNIFEVEFSNGLTMRVGYNHFPEGTDLRWKVTQNRIPVATGRFVAEGGGSTNHFETVTLGVKLEGRETQPDGADVQFDWTINDVPFRYSVRRDPNC